MVEDVALRGRSRTTASINAKDKDPNPTLRNIRVQKASESV
jgi:hypothetical protein